MSALALALFLVAPLTSVLIGQSTKASLSGRLTDPSKALIVVAAVNAISADTVSVRLFHRAWKGICTYERANPCF